jgi:steroid delta-isomerase-like uncharacterized protein
MSANLEANKRLVREHYEELVNRKNIDAAEEHLAADFVDHGAPPGTPRGPEAARITMRQLFAAIPDVRVTLEDMVAEGDRVAVRPTWRGTHQRTFLGVPPSRRAIALTGMVLWRVADGKIAERWATVDLKGLAPRSSLELNGILETALYVDDLGAADYFYGEVLKLKKIFSVPGRQLVFRCGESVLLIFDPCHTESERIVINGAEIPFHGSHGAGHAAFRVSEPGLNAWRQILRFAGIDIESEVSWPNGAQSLYFRDPAGNSLELATSGVWTPSDN